MKGYSAFAKASGLTPHISLESRILQPRPIGPQPDVLTTKAKSQITINRITNIRTADWSTEELWFIKEI